MARLPHGFRVVDQRLEDGVLQTTVSVSRWALFLLFVREILKRLWSWLGIHGNWHHWCELAEDGHRLALPGTWVAYRRCEACGEAQVFDSGWSPTPVPPVTPETEAPSWRQGPVECLNCGHHWIAVRPVPCDVLECPDCGKSAGFERLEIDPPARN